MLSTRTHIPFAMMIWVFCLSVTLVRWTAEIKAGKQFSSAADDGKKEERESGDKIQEREEGKEVDRRTKSSENATRM